MTKEYDWLLVLEQHPRFVKPRGPWARIVMAAHSNMSADDLYSETYAFLEWFGDGAKYKDMSRTFRGHLRRNDWRYKHKYKQRYSGNRQGNNPSKARGY